MGGHGRASAGEVALDQRGEDLLSVLIRFPGEECDGRIHEHSGYRRSRPEDLRVFSNRRFQYTDQEAFILDRENNPVPACPEPVDRSPGKPRRFPDMPVGVLPTLGNHSDDPAGRLGKFWRSRRELAAQVTV
jgi:hypothetical protein